FIGKTDPANQHFVAAFRAANNQEPDQFAAQAYDTLFILAAAIDRAGSVEPTRIRDALLKTDYSGLLGSFRFSPSRDPAATSGVVVTMVKEGKAVPLE
ncbi:MAG: ABC transporter substrate-binding protein, partial [Alphaproteobacteria bacterium]|nr:ABC transporter substrate-binding protein [Alphaproteobacteria bacterium]